MEIASFAQEHGAEVLKTMCSRSGGFVSHFGTSDARKIHAMMEGGDEKASIIWGAMVYQICKSIGAMAAVLDGHVDAIILTGGLVRYDDIPAMIKTKCSFIAPVVTYPGEVEQEELASAALDVLRGKEKAFRYTGKPVFQGFAWDKD